MSRRQGAVVAAFAVDLLLGEPPSVLHPTVWMGRWIAAGRHALGSRPVHPRTNAAMFVSGAAVVAGGCVLAAAAGMLAQRAVRRGTRRGRHVANAVLEGMLLKPALSVHALLKAARLVECALWRGDLPEARRLLGWHLVSRDTRTLTASDVAGAAIESLAENLSDAIVAPLMAYAVGGLPAAYTYRLINTADAMLGYRTADLEWFGKAAARMDDALNLVPARLTALLVALAAPLANGSARDAMRRALTDAHRTPSPNAGWPMAAMAGALGVRLEKRDTDGEAIYVLNPHGRLPDVADIARARRVVTGAVLLVAVVAELA